MGQIFKFFLTINSLSLSFVVFLVSKETTLNISSICFCNIPNGVSYLLYLLLVLAFTWISLHLKKFLPSESIGRGSISSIEPANDTFLPSYLGYFFIALSVNSFEMFAFVFGIICVFVFYSRISYFNPMFFIFKFNFYYVVTNQNNKILLITRKQIKDSNNLSLDNLRRINNYTFIDME